MLSNQCNRKLLTTNDCLNIINTLKEDIKKKQAFLESDQCLQMCADIKKLDETVTNDEFVYNHDEFKTKLNWCTLADAVIEQFFAAMCYFEDLDFDIDDECEFDNYMYSRNGLNVTLIYGQGALLTLCPKNRK